MTGINWLAFVLVLVVALGAAVLSVSLFSVGVRLLATPAPGTRLAGAAFEPDDPGEDDPTTPSNSRPAGATAGAVVAFVLAGAVAVAGVALIVH